MQSLVRIRNLLRLVVICALTCLSLPQARAMEPALWQKLKDGEAIAIMRHAIAPGNGDPSNFTLGECETQRNLSEDGQDQSIRIGDLFRSHGIEQAVVLSSQWCRCIDTANGLNFGTAESLPLLNSFYQDRSTEIEQTTELKTWLEARIGTIDGASGAATILVSHQVNITSLTGVYPASGEIVLVGYEDEQFIVLGTLETQ